MFNCSLITNLLHIGLCMVIYVTHPILQSAIMINDCRKTLPILKDNTNVVCEKIGNMVANEMISVRMTNALHGKYVFK